MKRNITLFIQKELLKKAKLIAAKKETSLTKLLIEQLAKVVSEDEQYDSAKKRTFLEVALPLNGKSPMNEDKIFVDTNVLVCGHGIKAGQKHEIAQGLLIQTQQIN